MLQEHTIQQVKEQISLLIEEQKKTTDALAVVNRRMMGFEQTFGLVKRYTQETVTYVKRIQPVIEKAMKTLQESFHLVCNGIWNLREETSEFAGNCINEKLDVRIV